MSEGRLMLRDLLYYKDSSTKEGILSAAKVALAIAMIEDDYDDKLFAELEEVGVKAVATRAGGIGDNVKNKLIRNAIAAAEKAGVVEATPTNKDIIIRCVESAMKMFEGTLSSIFGGGLKIGIARYNGQIAVAFYGVIGIPGVGGDREVCGVGVMNYGLEGE